MGEGIIDRIYNKLRPKQKEVQKKLHGQVQSLVGKLNRERKALASERTERVKDSAQFDATVNQLSRNMRRLQTQYDQLLPKEDITMTAISDEDYITASQEYEQNLGNLLQQRSMWERKHARLEDKAKRYFTKFGADDRKTFNLLKLCDRDGQMEILYDTQEYLLEMKWQDIEYVKTANDFVQAKYGIKAVELDAKALTQVHLDVKKLLEAGRAPVSRGPELETSGPVSDIEYENASDGVKALRERFEASQRITAMDAEARAAAEPATGTKTPQDILEFDD